MKRWAFPAEAKTAYLSSLALRTYLVLIHPVKMSFGKVVRTVRNRRSHACGKRKGLPVVPGSHPSSAHSSSMGKEFLTVTGSPCLFKQGFYFTSNRYGASSRSCSMVNWKIGDKI